MKFFSKIFILFISITILRLTFSCCSCENESYSFGYNNIIINNIDNSGQWSKPSEKDEMSAGSVAFEIQIAGTEVVVSESLKKLRINGFKALSAQDCNCDDQYTPNQEISEIHIRTLYDLNSEYCCNDEVTPLFLANTCVDCEDIGSFYITIDELQKRINPGALYHSPVNKFLIYLKVPVENDKAQFEIEVVLENGQSIVSTTNLIAII